MKIGIIGGGFTGLVLAYKLASFGIKIKLFEQNDQLGGLATYFNYGDFYWDKFYHVILPTDKYLLEFISDLNLENRLKWTRTYTGYYQNDKMYSLSSNIDFIKFSPLNVIQKARLAYTIYYGSKIENWQKLEKVSVSQWLIKMGGEELFRVFWKPLLLAKLGENYRKVSAVFIWSYIKRLFEARDKSARREHMGYVEGGYKNIIQSIEGELLRCDCEIVKSSIVQHIGKGDEGGIEILSSNCSDTFDKVICTTPHKVVRHIVDNKLLNQGTEKSEVEYLCAICLTLVTNEPITKYYVLNLADETLDVTGVIGMSTIVSLEETSGKYLTYFPKYLPSDDPLFAKSDDDIIKIIMPSVEKLFPNLKNGIIENIFVNKATQVQPLQVLNYSSIIQGVNTSDPNLFVLNSSQFLNDTLNNNTVVKHVNHFLESEFNEFMS